MNRNDVAGGPYRRLNDYFKKVERKEWGIPLSLIIRTYATAQMASQVSRVMAHRRYLIRENDEHVMNHQG
jgi:hypothetical protein